MTAMKRDGRDLAAHTRAIALHQPRNTLLGCLALNAADEIEWAADQIASLQRDVTALRSELGAIAILMQDRGQLPDPGGPNFALVEGAVMTYVLALELGVVALNEDRQGLLEQIGGLNNLLACDDDCHHAPMCVRWEHGSDPPGDNEYQEVAERERRYFDCASCGQHTNVDEAFYAATLCSHCSESRVAGFERHPDPCLPRCAGCVSCMPDAAFDPDYAFVMRDETGTPMIVSDGLKWPNDPSIT